MKLIVPLALSLLLIGCSSRHDEHNAKGRPNSGVDPHAAHDMEQGVSKMMIQTDPAQVITGKLTTLKLMIHDAAGEMVKKFEVDHEQKIHLIIVRDGLDQFAHIHPEVDAAGNATVSYTFPTGGNYWLYADHKPTGKGQTIATAQVKVSGDIPAIPSLTPNVPGEMAGDGLRAKIAIDGASAGGEGTITFDLTDMAGQPVVDLQPYMGAMGHLVVLSSDGKQYVHAHPTEAQGGKASRVVFQAHFMKPGIYKGWGQFRRMDTVRVLPFVLKVG
jgi:hypothetical protein